MYIYIRHAQKAYKNGKPFSSKDCPHNHRRKRHIYSHDPPLTHKGKEDAANLAEELLQKYPIPSRIITSPYLRTRQTANVMANVIVKKFSPRSIQITCQNDLSEYLGNHKSPIDITPETAKYHPPHPENFQAFQMRIGQYREDCPEPDEVIWVITHGIVINEIIRPFYSKKKIPYLGYITTTHPNKYPELHFD